MYDFNKIREGNNLKVVDLISELTKLNPKADLVICGDNRLIIHVEEDDSVVNIDTEYMEDEYREFGGYDEIPKICPISFDADNNNNFIDEED